MFNIISIKNIHIANSSRNLSAKMIIVNMLDRDQSNFNNTLDQLKERFGRQVFPFMIPINESIIFLNYIFFHIQT